MGFGVGLTSDLITVITKQTAAGNSCYFSVGVQGFAERSGLDSVFSAERSHLSYSWYELVLLSIQGRG